jgi:hypothetical protein
MNAPISKLVLLGFALVMAGCAGEIVGGSVPPEGWGDPGTGGGLGSLNGSDIAFTGLPCDVAQVLATRCVSCHGTTPAGGAPYPLVSRVDLLTDTGNGTRLERSIARMQLTTGAMPPGGATAADVATLQAWQTSGVPEFTGTCTNLGTGGGAGGGAGGGGGTTNSGGFAGLSCDVANVLVQKCTSCHGTPLTGGATFPLLSRADLIAPSPTFTGTTIGARSLVRMQSATGPMPPLPNAGCTAAQIATFQTWVGAGMPLESCANAPDAGTNNTGPQPTTCASNSFYTGGQNASMEPGKACRACHAQGGEGPMDQFMGTVFPGLHEKNRCNAMPPTGAVVEILDTAGAVQLTLAIRSPSGNFESGWSTAPTPYRARVRIGTRTIEMQTPQTNGDCNVCHTEQGALNAPGRIVFPP